MKESLREGLTFDFTFSVPENKTVPALLPESPEFQLMPRVLATGFLVGLIEWTCIQAVNPHLDWPEEQTVGIAVDLTHSAATPAGLMVTVTVRLEKIEGRKLRFAVEANDDLDEISSGFHERFVIDAERFNRKAAEKAFRAETVI
jgi:fluoroacetyl-CoA thioesterase